MTRALRVTVVVAVAAALSSMPACSAFEDLPDEQPCSDIPEGGCPGAESTDGSPTANCADPTCSALYACQAGGAWSLIAECPPHEGGVGDASRKLDAHADDYRELRDADFDVPTGASGGPGCVPLQCGDCDLSLALACPADQCCGCDGIFVCDDGGWDYWGYCDDAGDIVKVSHAAGGGR